MGNDLLDPNALRGDTRHRSFSNAGTLYSGASGSSVTRVPSEATSSIIEENIQHALNPDPGTEHDFHVEDNPFAFSPGQLNKLLNPKSLGAFRALGGLNGIAKGLQTDVTSGLSLDETNVASHVAFDDAVSASKEATAARDPPVPSRHSHTSG
ncbi:hypothetical protein FDECE_12238, partial [Fusarium decemcellulare]